MSYLLNDVSVVYCYFGCKLQGCSFSLFKTILRVCDVCVLPFPVYLCDCIDYIYAEYGHFVDGVFSL